MFFRGGGIKALTNAIGFQFALRPYTILRRFDLNKKCGSVLRDQQQQKQKTN